MNTKDWYPLVSRSAIYNLLQEVFQFHLALEDKTHRNNAAIVFDTTPHFLLCSLRAYSRKIMTFDDFVSHVYITQIIEKKI